VTPRDGIAPDSDDEDGRDTARFWTSFIYIALHRGIKTNYRGADLDLAFLIHEANAMRIVAQVACKQAELDFDELLGHARRTLEKGITKVAGRTFEKHRRRWTETFAEEGEPGASTGKSE